MESNARQHKIEEGQKQLKDLQNLRVKMETDLSGLRSERTQTLEHNAQLVEACDPEKYAKLQKEVIVCFSFQPSIHSCTHASIHLSKYSSVHSSIYLSIHLSTHPSTN